MVLMKVASPIVWVAMYGKAGLVSGPSSVPSLSVNLTSSLIFLPCSLLVSVYVFELVPMFVSKVVPLAAYRFHW